MRILIIILLCLLSFPALANDYQVERVKGDVYRFSAGHYHSIFIVSDDGILVSDPINAEAANYLKNYLQERFEQPIRYLVYSHNHIDHVRGGEVFAELGAEIIAHQYAAEDLVWTRAPTALPTQTFKQQLTLQLGEHPIQLRYHGPNNGRGSISVNVASEQVLFVADWIVIGRMPYQDLPGYDIHGMIRSTEDVLRTVPFDIFVGSHAELGNRDDVQRYLAYLKALYNAVLNGMLEGKSLVELKQTIVLPEYSDLKMYRQWLPLNIEGVYRTLNDQSYLDRH